MIVELIEEKDNAYLLLEDGSRWFIGTPSKPFKKLMEPIQEIVHSIKVKEALEPQEVVELCKSGIRADEIIRLRQAGVL